MSDTETALVEAAFPGTVEASPRLIESQKTFKAMFTEFPWIDSGETAALLAIQIASGSPADAGKDIEAQSVRNLKLVNKVHTITEVALAESSLGGNGPGFYARVSAVNTDGEVFTYSIGGWIPLGQLRAKASTFPWRCQIVETPSREGNAAYRYVDA